MNKTKVKEIIKFSFSKYFQNKWFVIFNVLSLLGVIISINWNNFSDYLNIDFGEDKYIIELLTNLDNIYEDFNNSFKDSDIFTIKKATQNNYTEENIPKDVIILEIKEDQEKFFNVKLTSKERIKTTYYNEIKDELNKIRNLYLKDRYSLESGDISFIQNEVEIERVMLGVDSSNSATKEIFKTLSSFFSYMVAILLFTRIANEVATEKNSKSSEYILTTVSGKEYLLAKVISNVAVLIVQFVLFLAYFLIATAILGLFKIDTSSITLESLNTPSSGSIFMEMLPYILVLLVLNVLSITLMSIIQATLAARANSSSEAGNTVSIIIFVMMLCYMLTIFLIEPTTIVHPAINLISIIPVFSAYFIPALMIIGQASTLQIVVSIILGLVSIPIAFELCHKRFKNGLLNYTKVKKSKKQSLTLEEEQTNYYNKKTFSSVGMVIGLTILIYISSSQLIGLIFSLIFDANFDNTYGKGLSSIITQILTQVLSSLFSILFLRFYTEKHNKKEEKSIEENDELIKKPKKWEILFICYSLVTLLNIIFSLALSKFTDMDYDMTKLFNTTSSSSILLKVLFVIAIAIIPAIFEELLFRKSLIDYLEKFGASFAIITSALTFGLIHMNLSQSIFAFCIGLIWGTIYLKTKDIKISMIVHAMNNGLAAIVAITPENDLTTQATLSIISISFTMLGIILLFSYLKKPKSNGIRLKLISSNDLKKDLKSKYKFMFYDFIFDLSIALIIVMSFITEKTLKALFK